MEQRCPEQTPIMAILTGFSDTQEPPVSRHAVSLHEAKREVGLSKNFSYNKANNSHNLRSSKAGDTKAGSKRNRKNYSTSESESEEETRKKKKKRKWGIVSVLYLISLSSFFFKKKKKYF